MFIKRGTAKEAIDQHNEYDFEVKDGMWDFRVCEHNEAIKSNEQKMNVI